MSRWEIHDNGDDWAAVYKDGALLYQDHPWNAQRFLLKGLGVTTVVESAAFDWDSGQFAETLKDGGQPSKP